MLHNALSEFTTRSPVSVYLWSLSTWLFLELHGTFSGFSNIKLTLTLGRTLLKSNILLSIIWREDNSTALSKSSMWKRLSEGYLNIFSKTTGI